MHRNLSDGDVVAALLAAHDDDYSSSFAKIRGRLTDGRGVHLVDYVGRLTPRYGRIYRDLALGSAAVVGAVIVVCVGQTAGISLILLVPLDAALVGFWFFYLASFIHEGVHWNLTPDRKTNDLICKVLMSCMLGVHVEVWRKHHFEHHRSLGTIHDTEITYFFPLNVLALLKSASGVRALEALLAYVRRTRDPGWRRSSSAGPVRGSHEEPKVWMGLITGVMAHGAIVAGFWVSGWTAASAAWVLGVAAVMPLLNTIRQVLEHRNPRARPDVDYTKIDQGACARIFGNGWLDRLFGSAGANRHLLHHWEPQVSYTRLADLERFLADTPARVIMERRRTTYYRALREVFSPS